jgi:hypothetical protein
MRTSARLALAASATFAFATLGAVAPAQANENHCPDGGTKYEVDAGPTYDTDLPVGTEVCIKAGNNVIWDYADADGVIENDQILNPAGKAYLGISYYVVYTQSS